jgi:signal transduction histidine kinase
MATLSSGQAKIVARARLMMLLGEQLITDEIAAISELAKNAYDADAKKVIIELSHVSEPENGYIMVKDNGHGMTRETVLSSWLELGTLSKARGSNLKPRLSEFMKRVYLGEKGLGRLAINKLGDQTELVTRRVNTSLETKILFDFIAFEKSDGFLEEIPINWEETKPQIFTEVPFTNGTQITIRKLKRVWNSEMISRIQRNLLAMKCPFEDLGDFDIEVKVDDKEAPEISVPNIVDLVRKATYRFTGEIDSTGQIVYQYEFDRPDFPNLKRKMSKKRDVRNPKFFMGDRKPVCGPFRVRFYAWDLGPQDKRAVFGDTSTYDEMIRLNTGVKVYRDGFRVLPYGNQDNDWLSMDMERIRRFDIHVSRNQVICAIEISSVTNPNLLDKTDREGLIDNEEFGDFCSLVKGALGEFEAERYKDRYKLKVITGKIRSEKTDRTVFTKNMAMLSNIIASNPKIDAEVKLGISKVISETREIFDSMIREKEQPLLVAATIGLTYMMPTHEVRRELHESLKILRKLRESKEVASDQIESIISLLKQADSTVGGIGRLMQQTEEDEVFKLEKTATNAWELMRYRLERNNIEYEPDMRKSLEITGSDKLITILLLNLLDNSIYWLLRKKPEERKIKIIIDSYEDGAILVVSDSGPGFGDDDIQTLTLPFFTRKPNGMGLGLYISDRIAKMNRGYLKILSENEISGLLPGANIAVIFPKKRR